MQLGFTLPDGEDYEMNNGARIKDILYGMIHEDFQCVYYDNNNTEQYSKDLTYYNGDIYNSDSHKIDYDSVIALRNKRTKEIVYYNDNIRENSILTPEMLFNKLIYKQKMEDSLKGSRKGELSDKYTGVTCLYFDEKTGSMKQASCMEVTDFGLKCRYNKEQLGVPLDKVYALTDFRMRGTAMLYENKSVIAKYMQSIKKNKYVPLNNMILNSINGNKITLRSRLEYQSLDNLISRARIDAVKERISDSLNKVVKMLGFKAWTERAKAEELNLENTGSIKAEPKSETGIMTKTVSELMAEGQREREEIEKNLELELGRSIQAGMGR